jgi:transposase-like protein
LGVSLFWQPVATAAATLEEWVRYPAPSSQNVLEDRGFRGDLVLQTTNTTIIALPGKPSFLVANYEEGAESVATLRPLLENWRRQVLESVAKASDALESIDKRVCGSQRPNGRYLQSVRTELEQEQVDLRKRKSEVTAELALLKSPTLVDTAIQREYLDRLWCAAGLDKEEADLTASIQQAQDLYDTSVAVAAGLETRSQDRWSGRLNAAVSFVGITGLADFFSLMNDAASGDQKWVVIGEIAFIIFLLIVLLLIAFVVYLGPVRLERA